MTIIAALTSIGTAVTFGAATGLGATVVGGITAGTVTGATVGTIKAAASGEDIGKGALMGAVAGGVTGGVAPGLGAAVATPLVSAVGPVATGALVGGVAGAAGGAASSAVGGQDVGKGALMGGASGAVAGGAMGAMPAPSGVPSIGVANPSTPAEGAFSSLGTGEVVGSNAGAAQFDSAIGSVPGSAGYTPPATLGGTPTTVTSSGLGIGNIGPKIGIQPATALGSAEPTGVIGGLSKQIETGAVGLAGVAGTEYAGKSIIDAQDAVAKAAAEDKARGLDFASQGSSGLAGVRAAGLPEGTGPLGGLGSIGRATGGITALAHGGQVALGDGAYIIPADVVSALGNGSSKAGADYLRRLMIEVRKEAVGRQGMGAAKKHVS